MPTSVRCCVARLGSLLVPVMDLHSERHASGVHPQFGLETALGMIRA